MTSPRWSHQHREQSAWSGHQHPLPSACYDMLARKPSLTIGPSTTPRNDL